MKTSLSLFLAALDAAKTVYVCPMDPDVVKDAPGVCPKCNMKLEPRTEKDHGSGGA